MESIFLKAIRLKENGLSDQAIRKNLLSTIDIWGAFPSEEQIKDAIDIANKALHVDRESDADLDD